MSLDWLDIAKELYSIAQAGLTYSNNKYDIERYQKIIQLSLKILNEYTNISFEKLSDIFKDEKGYPTPKIDIRGAVFRNNKILLVKETIDGKWSVPGGWADIGYSPREVVIKELKEETGLDVQPIKLLAVLDKKSHKHPPDFFHVYKLFFLCEEIGGKLQCGIETCDIDFFSINNLPPLSETRITKEQIEMLFEFYYNPNKAVICD